MHVRVSFLIYKSTKVSEKVNHWHKIRVLLAYPDLSHSRRYNSDYSKWESQTFVYSLFFITISQAMFDQFEFNEVKLIHG